jgi:hypothetical protein
MIFVVSFPEESWCFVARQVVQCSREIGVLQDETKEVAGRNLINYCEIQIGWRTHASGSWRLGVGDPCRVAAASSLIPWPLPDRSQCAVLHPAALARQPGRWFPLLLPSVRRPRPGRETHHGPDAAAYHLGAAPCPRPPERMAAVRHDAIFCWELASPSTSG